MSDYHYYKVLRVPTDKYNLGDLEKFEMEHNDVFGHSVGYFHIAPTVTLFLDFILEESYGDRDGDYGKVRDLRPNEKIMYYDIFHMVIPNIQMNDVRLVEFCWYNCCEAPDYYAIEDDPFYADIPDPSELK